MLKVVATLSILTLLCSAEVIDRVAAADARVAVVGNPANTNAMIAASVARRLPAVGRQAPARVLEQALGRIDARYGRRTGDVVALQLEYPRSG